MQPVTLCDTCSGYFMDAESCTADGIRFPDGHVSEAIPYGSESIKRDDDRCPDCGVERDGFHHPGCEVAECPRCGEPLVDCGCLADG